MTSTTIPNNILKKTPKATTTANKPTPTKTSPSPPPPPLKKKKKKKSRKPVPGRTGRYHTGTYISPKCKKPIAYRSGWEKTVCEWLDQDSSVVEYFYEDLIIGYKTKPTQVKTKKYIIDFLVFYSDGSKKIIEVKADNKVNHPITLKKTAAAKEWCGKNNVVYEIWSGNKIKEILQEQKKLLTPSKTKI